MVSKHQEALAGPFYKVNFRSGVPVMDLFYIVAIPTLVGFILGMDRYKNWKTRKTMQPIIDKERKGIRAAMVIHDNGVAFQMYPKQNIGRMHRL